MRDIALFRLTMASYSVGFGAMWALVFHSSTVYGTLQTGTEGIKGWNAKTDQDIMNHSVLTVLP